MARIAAADHRYRRIFPVLLHFLLVMVGVEVAHRWHGDAGFFNKDKRSNSDQLKRMERTVYYGNAHSRNGNRGFIRQVGPDGGIADGRQES